MRPPRYALNAITSRTWLLVPWSEHEEITNAVKRYRMHHKVPLVVSTVWATKPVMLRVGLEKA